MKINQCWLAMLSLSVLISSCYPSMNADVSDLDVIVTVYDQDRDFKNHYTGKTFAIPNQIHIIRDEDNPENNVDIDSAAVAEASIAAVRENMNLLGWTEIPQDQVNENNVPDVVMLISVNARISYGAFLFNPWWPWWGGWGGWGPWWPGHPWGPGWGGWWPPAVGFFSYEEGSILIDMADPADMDLENQRIYYPWAGGINGLLRSSSGSNQAAIQNGIDRIFHQSPYLNVK